MKNYTISFSTIDEVDALLDYTLKDDNKTLIQIFCASHNLKEIENIQTYFNNKFKNSVIIGSTTDGTIDGIDSYVETKNVVTFTMFEKSHIKSTLIKHDNKHNGDYKMGKRLAKSLYTKNIKLIISFADGINTNGEEFVNGVFSVDKNVVISGGLAADNGKLVKTYVFDNTKIISNGAVGISLSSDNLSITTSYTFDWMPIGKKLKITKAIKNRVYEIDGKTAVDVYTKYLGEDLASRLPQIGIEFPLVFEKDGLSVGRAVLFKHDDGSLTFAGNINEGTNVYFGIGSIDSILKNSDYNVRKIFNKLQYKTEAIFVYSCMARRRFMNEYMNDELKSLSYLGPVSGFFTYGEFFHTKKSNQLLNETMTIIALSETEEEICDNFKKSINEKHVSVLSKEHVISHLANVVSHELAELNTSLEKRIEEHSAFIYKQAYFDRLTGLPNRLSLIKRLDESLGKTIVLVNIDDFTSINDFYGHEYGDKVLKKLSKLLKQFISDESAEVFKLPSDEFAIIIDTKNKKSSVEERIKGCIRSVNKENFNIDESYTYVSVTASAALINKNKNGFANADMTLKLAKRAGLDYMMFDDDLQLAKKYEQNLTMAKTIKNAINTDNIIAYYQPLFNIKTGKIDKYEALVRLRKDDGTILLPFSFLEISQKIKLYPQITKIMVENTFSFFKSNGLDFSINLSFSDILDEKMRKFIFGKIDKYKIGKQLTIEILETQENDNCEIVNHFIDEVYSYGAKIAIDDFGSGFANFQHMTTMRSDIMKIDGSLIKNIDKDKNARLVVETIIVFAKKLNKKIVAEFVHSKEIYEIVKELDIDYAQGFYLGKPQENII